VVYIVPANRKSAGLEEQEALILTCVCCVCVGGGGRGLAPGRTPPCEYCKGSVGCHHKPVLGKVLAHLLCVNCLLQWRVHSDCWWQRGQPAVQGRLLWRAAPCKTNEPRAATVAASQDTLCLVLDRDTFVEILGPLDEAMKVMADASVQQSCGQGAAAACDQLACGVAGCKDSDNSACVHVAHSSDVHRGGCLCAGWPVLALPELRLLAGGVACPAGGKERPGLSGGAHGALQAPRLSCCSSAA